MGAWNCSASSESLSSSAGVKSPTRNLSCVSIEPPRDMARNENWCKIRNITKCAASTVYFTLFFPCLSTNSLWRGTYQVQTLHLFHLRCFWWMKIWVRYPHSRLGSVLETWHKPARFGMFFQLKPEYLSSSHVPENAIFTENVIFTNLQLELFLVGYRFGSLGRVIDGFSSGLCWLQDVASPSEMDMTVVITSTMNNKKTINSIRTRFYRS